MHPSPPPPPSFPPVVRPNFLPLWSLDQTCQRLLLWAGEKNGYYYTQALQKNPAVRPSAKHLVGHPWIQMFAPEVIPADQPHMLLQSLSLVKPPTLDVVLADSSRPYTSDSVTGVSSTADGDKIMRTGSQLISSRLAVRTSPPASGNQLSSSTPFNGKDANDTVSNSKQRESYCKQWKYLVPCSFRKAQHVGIPSTIGNVYAQRRLPLRSDPHDQ